METLIYTLAGLAPLLWLAGMLVGVLGTRVLASLLYAIASLDVIALSLYILARSTSTLLTLPVFLPEPLGSLRLLLGFDVLTSYFLAAMGISWFVASTIHSYYWRVEQRESRLYTLLLGFSMLSMYLVTISRDLLSLLASWEAMSFSLGMLIAYSGEHRSRLASLFYLMLMHVLSLPMMAVIAYLLATGITWYTGIKALPFTIEVLVISSFLLAFTSKSGLFPFYEWLPPGHSLAPSDASVVLSGSSVKPSILQAMLLLMALGVPQPVLLILAIQAVASIVIGVLGALWTRHGKRILAYTTVAYMGLAWLLAVAYMWVDAIQLVYALAAVLLAHAAYKSMAFAAAGVAKAIWHTDNLAELGGLCWSEKLCGVATLAASNMGVLPPFARYYGELIALLALASVLPAYKILVLPIAVTTVIMAVFVGLAYMRLLSSLQATLEPPQTPPEPSIATLFGLSTAATLAPLLLTLWAWWWSVLPPTALVILTVLVFLATIVGLLTSRRGARAPVWVSGEEIGYARRVVPSAAPLAVPAPRKALEDVLSRIRRPWIREIGYEGLYRAIARGFEKIVLHPLLAPMMTGSLGIYISIMLAYFVTLLVLAWWYPW